MFYFFKKKIKKEKRKKKKKRVVGVQTQPRQPGKWIIQLIISVEAFLYFHIF
jgi:hypothetical protein